MWPLLDSGPTETLPLLEQIFQNLEQQQIPLHVNVCWKVWTKNMAEMQYFFLHLIELFWFWIWAFFPDSKCRMLLLVAVHVCVCVLDQRKYVTTNDCCYKNRYLVLGWEGVVVIALLSACIWLTVRIARLRDVVGLNSICCRQMLGAQILNTEWHMRHSGLMANGIPHGRSKPDSIGTRDCTNQAMGCKLHKRC